eukprot:g11838.t1
MRVFDSKYTTAFLLGVLTLVSVYELPSTHVNLSNFNSKQFFRKIWAVDKNGYSKEDIEEELRREYMLIQSRAENKTHGHNVVTSTLVVPEAKLKTEVERNNSGLQIHKTEKTVALKPARGGGRLCLTGKPYGYINENNPGWSNFVLAVHHARRIVASQHDPRQSDSKVVYNTK